MADVAAIAGIVGAVAAVGGTVMSVQAANTQAKAQRSAAAAQAQQYEQQQLAAETAAKQQEARTRANLNRNLRAQDAIIAAGGRDIDSPTANALAGYSTESAMYDITNARITGDLSSAQYGTAAQRALATGNTQADATMAAGYTQAVSSAATAADRSVKAYNLLSNAYGGKTKS
ncbi:hypothetical protein M0638_22230 [Roseomonas sp. NAR14]|uniref:Uncharacterized protein n=1 Tax=Roseomonas acroporae TaxID=2937791 RepID=A0A9X1YEB5_9PROT|nr:hypothetical protein [Roseomonas acroporae]MCK8787097.1 hypothetical protein [Roseomonas acroporae]